MPPDAGNYQCLDRIGEGGMGEVWRARHRTMGGLAAVKLVRPEVMGESAAKDAEVVARLMREARVASALRSPHSIRMLDVGTLPDGRVWLAMELLDGLDLDQLVRRFGPQAPARVVVLLRQAVAALAEAHGLGLVHRDVKPSNVFLCPGGPLGDLVKVLDFGLARAAGPAADSGLTRTGVIPGSPAWLAPEVLRGGDPTDRADVYALGCVAWWLLTGRLVFEARSPLELVVAHLERPVPPWPEHAPVPDRLRELVSACLAKDPTARPTASALGAALADLPGLDPWSEREARAWWAAALPTGTLLPPAPDAPTEADAATVLTPPGLPAELPAAREAAWTQLRRHFEASRIDVADFDERCTRARRATDRDGVLAALEGLPVEVPTAPPRPTALDPKPPPELPVPRTPTAELAHEGRGAADRHRLRRFRERPVVSVLGSTTRAGLWAGGEASRAVSVLGSITVDLVETPLGPGVHELRCVAVFGSVTVRVPPDLPVEVAGVGVVGSFEGRGAAPPSSATPGGPRLVLTGVSVFGSVDVVVVKPPDPSLVALKEAGRAAAGVLADELRSLTTRKR